MPANVIKISESGIHSNDDVRRLASVGYDAFLVGEHLMKSEDPAAALRALRS
jgi:indole-3-glycerol phosphate synthase